MSTVENLKALHDKIEEEHMIQAWNNPQAPVSKYGRLDWEFAKSLVDPQLLQKKPDGSPDYKTSLALRELFYRGYENKKSAKPGRDLAPVPEEEILAAIGAIANPPVAEAVDNRYVHK